MSVLPNAIHPSNPANHHAHGRVCPKCNGPVRRVRRHFIDRLVSLITPVRRYRCHEKEWGWGCDWEGILPNRSLKLPMENSLPTQINKFPRPLMWIAGISIIFFSIVGIAAFMGFWIPSSIGKPGDKAAPSGSIGVKAHTVPTHMWQDTHSKATCAECGVIQSTGEIVQLGEGGAIDIVGGAVVGGLIGNQVGTGRGKDIATVAGAEAGNEIQTRVDTTKHYEIVVRFDDGSSRAFTETDQTAWRAGDHVKVTNGVIRSNN